MNDLYLAHHGVKGQKWGVRRYENYDGTLTDAGNKRYHGPFKNFRQKRAEKKAAKQQRRAEQRDIREQMNAARSKRNYKTHSDEMQKLINDYESEMNSDKMRALRAEAKKAARDQEDASRAYDQAERHLADVTRNPEKAYAGDKLMARAGRYLYEQELDSKMDKRIDASEAYQKEYKKIDDKYVQKFKDQAVKEIYPKDIERGRQLLDKYNMWDEYISVSNTRYQYRKDY